MRGGIRGGIPRRDSEGDSEEGFRGGSEEGFEKPVRETLRGAQHPPRDGAASRAGGREGVVEETPPPFRRVNGDFRDNRE